MFMINPGKLLATALFGAAVGFFQPANATTIIDVNLGSADLTCNAGSPTDNECAGYITGGTRGQLQALAPGVQDFIDADVYDVIFGGGGSNALEIELAALKTVVGSDADGILIGDVFKQDTGGDLFGFVIDPSVLFWSIKLGAGTAYFANLATMATTNFVDYTATGMAGGLSHIISYGGELTIIPLPAALPMFLLVLGGTALVARRRRGVADAA